MCWSKGSKDSCFVKRFLSVIFYKALRSIELGKYDDFTIAEHFRKLGAVVGDDNRIEVRSFGAEPYLIRIGNHCTISPGVSFLTHDGGAWVFSEQIPGVQKFGPIEIRDNSFIGLSSIIMGGVTIGPNSVVGAGSVVTKDVPPNSIVAGNPARFIRKVEEYKDKVLCMWKEQKPPGYFRGIEEGVRYSSKHIQWIKQRDIHMLRNHLIKLFQDKTS